MNTERRPLALIIIDGWGYSASREGNAIALANTPHYDKMTEKYPFTLLEAHGSRVGLPAGVMGNSEVGHLNIGSGRVIRMDVSLVDHEIETGAFFKNSVLTAAMENAQQEGRALHLMGLLSDGQVHSSITHLYALLAMAKQYNLRRVFLHAFLDGRDTPPSSALTYVNAIQRKMNEVGCGEIASVVGRYYAMDRDKRWERTQRAYDLLIYGKGEPTTTVEKDVRSQYERGLTDEFIEPVVVIGPDGPIGTIKDNDSVIFFNFRPDRARQLTRALNNSDFKEFSIETRPKVHYVCFTMYDATFQLPIAFPPRPHRNVLAEVLGAVTVNNFRMAETEKYAHVTYFFNGGVEKEFPCEHRLLVPSPKVATYDLMPEMSAIQVTNEVTTAIDSAASEVFVVNFANPDMVGHTGKLAQTIEACQYVDTCLERITSSMQKVNGVTLITADHGNAEQMLDLMTGQPHTAHTTNPVPFHLIDDDSIGGKLREGGALEDVAPTLLGLLNLDKPTDMTGRDLREL